MYFMLMSKQGRKQVVCAMATTSMTFTSLEAKILSNGKCSIEGALMKLNPSRCWN